MSDAAPRCDYCAVGPRLPGLIICSTCYGLWLARAHVEITDDSAPPAKCESCGREGTPEGEFESTPDPVALCVVEGDDHWTCWDCIEGDTPESWQQ